MRPEISLAKITNEQNFAIFRQDRRPVMVISHERSGTHFLMNALARAYGYISNPWFDLDPTRVPVNFTLPSAVADVLAKLADSRIASVVKSHHPAPFFDGILSEVLSRYTVFYIHRDPVEVMLSFWRLMHGFQWHEGPRSPDPVSFAAAAPEGHMMRYQMHQHASVIQRWARHVESWQAAASAYPDLRLVSYAALRDDYAGTMTGLAPSDGMTPIDLTPPGKDENVIRGGTVDRRPDVDELRRFVEAEAGETMRRLGYL